MSGSNGSITLQNLTNGINRLLEDLQTLESTAAIPLLFENTVLKTCSGVKYEHVVREDEQSICAVCLFMCKLNDCLWKLPCKHVFHSRCVYEWLNVKDSCPICRKSVLNTS